jgi:hypothetical protein
MLQKIKNWWVGEFVPTPLSEILGGTPETERFKKPKTRIFIESLWSFWDRHWFAILTLLVALLAIGVTLFVHFDSKTPSKTTHKQGNPE